MAFIKVQKLVLSEDGNVVFRFCPNTEKKDYDSLMPWNADLKRLDVFHDALMDAKPDPDRKEPYVLCGFSR